MKKPAAFGKYFLLERINVGGMAEVFRAKAFGVEGFERLVAVKRILPNIAEDKEFIRMFIEEAKLSVQLNHANIAQIFDLGVVEGAYYIALEHVHGRDLRGIFDRCHQLGEVMPIAQACFIAMKVCEGLDYAHNKRDQTGRELSLVHRDVSPQNVLVSFEGEVKLIDFGIAKAAGTGAKTQAGILKGKFGYMSPEQVRGLQVDRRSDVFSCGIVLYELLTGERLFVGESDFSTLEKVRNVEILPPSTYNRKIPDELERIVLKALTKDVEDRYQNAIDLHDELQAFVYTAGEFYSRKDLATWMKKTFAKEIEEETAKLESYRQLKPPVPAPVSGPVAAPASGAGSAAVPSAAAASTSAPASAAPAAPSAPLVLPGSGRVGSGAAPVPTAPTVPPPLAIVPAPPPVVVVAKPPPPPVARSQPVAVLAKPPTSSAPMPALKRRAGQLNASDLGWDDDDIETRIYDEEDPRRKAARRANLPLQPPVSSSPGIALAAESDLSSLAQGPGWDPGASPAPTAFPSGSNKGPSPVLPERAFDPLAREDAPTTRSRELSGAHRAAAAVAAPGPGGPGRVTLDPMASFGMRITGGRRPRDRRNTLAIALGVATIAVVATGAVMLWPRGAKPVKPQPVVDPGTGFDLYVTPPGMRQWKLDGDARNDQLPSKIRGIMPGTHTVEIEAPPGFLSQLQKVTIETGKAPRVDIVLQPMTGIIGVFESVPPGANVSLIVDGKRQPIGPSPARAPLDPRSVYQVLFEKSGYVSVNRPVAFSGALEEKVSVNLEKADAPPSPPPSEPRPQRSPDPSPSPSPRPSAPAPAPRSSPPASPAPATPRESLRETHRTSPPADKPRDKASDSATDAPEKVSEPAAESRPSPDSKGDAKGQGVLVLSSKPPCEIYIDGAAIGLHTPQKEIKLPAGRHRVTLLNNEFGIKETFSVDIKSDASEKVIRDYSDKLP